HDRRGRRHHRPLGARRGTRRGVHQGRGAVRGRRPPAARERTGRFERLVTWKLGPRARCLLVAMPLRPRRHPRESPVAHEHDAAPAPVREAGAHYDFTEIQNKWLPVWDELKPFSTADPDDKRPRKYVLDMFPYPSGDLHMGHAEAYALGDVIARYWRHQGFNVLHPIGWDSFGLPAENAAIKRGLDPAGWTNDNIAQQKASMRRYAPSFDWDRVLQTSDPAYYRWNQWLFLKLYEKGLAYRKASQVNWCPFDQTVLANEQVVNGRCERCDNLVTKKKLTQWY